MPGNELCNGLAVSLCSILIAGSLADLYTTYGAAVTYCIYNVHVLLKKRPIYVHSVMDSLQ